MKKLICCDVFKEEVLAFQLPEDMDTKFISMGLHLHPAKLHEEVQRVLDMTRGYEQVILGFGLCGSSLHGIRVPDCPLVMPRVHDCIPVLLGSRDKFNSLRGENNRTFYFSGGWVEGDRMMISEYARSCQQFGESRAQRVFRKMFEHYNRLLYIRTGHPRDLENFGKTGDFAAKLQLPCFQTRGNTEYLQKLVFGPWDHENFVLIPAHGIIDEAEFLAAGEKVQIQGV